MSTNFEDIRTILNRIDGVNVPVQEAPKQKAMSVDKIYDMVQNLEHVIQQHPDFKDYDKSIIMASLGQLKDDIAAGDLKETSVKEDISDKGRIALEKAGFEYEQSERLGYEYVDICAQGAIAMSDETLKKWIDLNLDHKNKATCQEVAT